MRLEVRREFHSLIAGTMLGRPSIHCYAALRTGGYSKPTPNSSPSLLTSYFLPLTSNFGLVLKVLAALRGQHIPNLKIIR